MIDIAKVREAWKHLMRLASHFVDTRAKESVDTLEQAVDELERLQKIEQQLLYDINILKPQLAELERLKEKETPMKWLWIEDENGSREECPLCHYPSFNDLGHNYYCTVCGKRLENWSETE